MNRSGRLDFPFLLTLTEGGEEHELAKQPTRRVLAPESFVGVISGQKEAGEKVPDENTHADLDRDNMEEAKKEERNVGNRAGIVGKKTRKVDGGGGEVVEIPADREEVQVGKGQQHARSEEAVDGANDGGATDFVAHARRQRPERHIGEERVPENHGRAGHDFLVGILANGAEGSSKLGDSVVTAGCRGEHKADGAGEDDFPSRQAKKTKERESVCV